MNPSRRDLTRLVALGSAAAVIGVPIVLVAATWQPLEPVPRGNEAESGDAEDAPVQEPRDRNRRDRQDRDRDDATPRPNPSE